MHSRCIYIYIYIHIYTYIYIYINMPGHPTWRCKLHARAPSAMKVYFNFFFLVFFLYFVLFCFVCRPKVHSGLLCFVRHFSFVLFSSVCRFLFYFVRGQDWRSATGISHHMIYFLCCFIFYFFVLLCFVLFCCVFRFLFCFVLCVVKIGTVSATGVSRVCL